MDRLGLRLAGSAIPENESLRGGVSMSMLVSQLLSKLAFENTIRLYIQIWFKLIGKEDGGSHALQPPSLHLHPIVLAVRLGKNEPGLQASLPTPTPTPHRF